MAKSLYKPFLFPVACCLSCPVARVVPLWCPCGTLTFSFVSRWQAWRRANKAAAGDVCNNGSLPRDWGHRLLSKEKTRKEAKGGAGVANNYWGLLAEEYGRSAAQGPQGAGAD